MKPSPLTFLKIEFIQVHVSADYKAEDTGPKFDFEGALIALSIKHGQHKEDGTWWVAVGFRTKNPPDAEALCPYIIDVFAVGTFEVAEAFEEDRKERLVYENGAALVYGSIRDMVSTITARSSPGLLMLPTPTFMGEFDLYKENSTKKPRKKPVKKNQSLN